MNPKLAKPGYWALVFVFANLVLHAKCQDDDDESMDEGMDEGMDSIQTLSPETMRSLHNLVDTDQDGKASLLEFTNYAAEMRKVQAFKDIDGALKELDANGDGKLSIDELVDEISKHTQEATEKKGMHEKQAALLNLEKEKFKVADINGDGFLTKEEVPSMFFPEHQGGVLELVVQHTLSSRDKDNDGQLSEHEFWQGEREGQEEIEISEEDHNDFKKLDTNGDDLLNSDELKVWETGAYNANEALKAFLEHADEDQDNHLSAGEIEAATEFVSEMDANYHFMEWAEHSEL